MSDELSFMERCFDSLGKILGKIQESGKADVSIWYNTNISRYPLFEPVLFQKNILVPIDLFTSKEQLMSAEDIRLNFNASPNFLNYFRLKLGLKYFLGNSNNNGEHFARPFIPSQNKVILKSKKRLQRILQCSSYCFR